MNGVDTISIRVGNERLTFFVVRSPGCFVHVIEISFFVEFWINSNILFSFAIPSRSDVEYLMKNILTAEIFYSFHFISFHSIKGRENNICWFLYSTLKSHETIFLLFPNKHWTFFLVQFPFYKSRFCWQISDGFKLHRIHYLISDSILFSRYKNVLARYQSTEFQMMQVWMQGKEKKNAEWWRLKFANEHKYSW